MLGTIILGVVLGNVITLGAFGVFTIICAIFS